MKDLASFMTLEDGEIIMTKTPAGVGAVSAGQHFNGRVVSAGKILAEHSWPVV